MSNDFILDILAALNKQLSKRQIKGDLKSMDNSMYVKVIAKLTTVLSKQQLKKDLKKLNDLYIQIGADIKVDKNTKTQLQNRIKELQKSLSELEINLKLSKYKTVNNIDFVRKEIQTRASKVPIEFDIEIKRSKAIADIEYLGKRFSKLFTNVAAKQKYENILMSAYSISDETQLKSVRNQIAAFTSELKANGLASQSLGDKWRSLIDKSKNLLSAASIVTAIFTQVKQAISTFLKLDTAMTNLYKVTDDITSRDQFSGLLTKWNKLAQNLAITTESLINSAAEWSKIGFNLDMSEQLAQITAIFEKTAEISNQKASSTLISAAQAFTEIGDLGEEDYVARVEAIGDRINAIGNKYAISSEGIADGLQNASAALKVAGNDLNETIALITATNKVFQNPEEGSNMLKVASMRLRGQVDALKEMGEDAEGVSTDLTKIQQQIYELTGNKVNIFENEDTLKSTYQIILEIGEVFDSLNDRSQADLLEKMFGKQRSSAGASLLLNYEELEKIKNDSMNAANSMAEEYSKYMESAEAHITIFKEKLVETYSAFISADMIKYTADIGSGILDLVNTTDLLRHGILAVLALKIGQGATAVGAAIASTSKQMNTLGSALQQVKNLPLDDVLKVKPLIEIGEATQNLTEKNLKLLLSNKKLEYQDKILILQQHNLTEEEAKAKLQKMGLTTATNAQSAANVKEAATTNVLKGAMGTLKASILGVGTSIKVAFMSNPVGFILTGIVTVVSLATAAMSKHNQKLEETRQKSAELTEEYKQQQSSLDSQIEKYKELKESLDKGNLSTDEARSTKEQLLEIQKSLVDSYGNEASNIDLVNGKYKEQLDLLSELSKKKAEDYVTENRDSFDEAKKALEEINEYNLGEIVNWSTLYPKTEKQQALLDYIKAYSDLFEITETINSSRGYSLEARNLEIHATVDDANELMHQFAKDLEEYGKENAIDVSGILNRIPEQIRKTQTDELKEYKSIYDEFMKAEVIRNDTLRPLYQQSIQAVEDYNKALSSGEGIAAAKENLDSLQQSVQDATVELEGSQAIFDGIFEGINKNAEADYHLSQAFENDSTIQKYAEQLRGLSDIDIKAINLDNENIEKGEEAFRGLLETLGYTEPTEEQIQSLIDKLVELGYVVGETKNIETPYEIFSTFIDTDFGTRIQHITDMFNEGTISHKEYFDALQSEIDNFDASNFTDSMEDMTKASAQFFVDSMQQAADGLSGLINSFDNGEMSISEYLEGYLAIGNTLSTLTDNLQENSAAWNEHGEAISEVGNTALDDTQNKLNSAMSIIESYQDSIYSLEQIMNDAVTVGSDEFTAHANVIAEDLYYIIQTGGEMADTIANTLGTTTSEIAQSLTENVSNQEIACQAIMANTNNAITSMADSIGQLFDTLGNAISNFKVDLSFGVKTIDWKKVNVLGTELSLPEIKFELGASGESLDKIGSALSSFGKTIASNYTPQTIELEDFHFGSTDAAKDRKYSPSSGITNNYENALDRIKDATKSTSSSAKSEFEEMVDFFERRIDELEDALSLLKTSLDNVSGSFAKNNLIDAELGITEEKFNNYTDALAMYTQKANEALSKLPADIAAKVKDGAVALTDFIGDGNKDVVEAIKEYESWADKVSDCKQELEELKTTIRQLELEKFNNIMDDFSNQFDLRGDSKNLISKQIDLLKEAGELIGESFYTAQINQSKKQLELLENEKAQLVNQMSSAIGSGRVNCCPLLQ